MRAPDGLRPGPPHRNWRRSPAPNRIAGASNEDRRPQGGAWENVLKVPCWRTQRVRCALAGLCDRATGYAPPFAGCPDALRMLSRKMQALSKNTQRGKTRKLQLI